jgi:hypothetical protein
LNASAALLTNAQATAVTDKRIFFKLMANLLH